METKPRVMPGDVFSVEYGGGRSVEVVALAGKAQRVLGALLDELRKTEQSQEIERACELAEQALYLCVSDKQKAESMWETELDVESAIEIAGATFAKQSMSVGEQKKVESLP